MANIFTRIKNIVVADINEILDKKEQKNPVSVLNQYIRRCEQETEKVRKLIERQYMLKNEFARELAEAEALEEKRRRQAEIAATAGETELEQFARQEAAQYEARAGRLKEGLAKVEEDLVSLEKKYDEMKHKLKDMKIRRLELMGRENAARAHYCMNQVLENGKYANESYSRFKEMEAFLDNLEEKVRQDYHRNTIDARIAELERKMAKEA